MDQPSTTNDQPSTTEQDADERRHYEVLFEQLLDWLELPMAVLGLIWLALLILEFTVGLHPALSILTLAIWVTFVLVFVMEFTLAPDKTKYLRRNWLTVIALAVPALRVFRLARAFRVLSSLRAVRGLSLLRVVSSMNRGIRALQRTLVRRNFGYVMAITGLATLAGAAGIYAFERDGPNSAGFDNYAESLYWTMMLLTTIGSEHWPATAEGRFLTVLLSLLYLGVFGYITATIATYLIGREADDAEADIAGAADIRDLRDEIAALRAELSAARRREGPQ